DGDLDRVPEFGAANQPDIIVQADEAPIVGLSERPVPLMETRPNAEAHGEGGDSKQDSNRWQYERDRYARLHRSGCILKAPLEALGRSGIRLTHRRRSGGRIACCPENHPAGLAEAIRRPGWNEPQSGAAVLRAYRALPA